MGILAEMMKQKGTCQAADAFNRSHNN